MKSQDLLIYQVAVCPFLGKECLPHADWVRSLKRKAAERLFTQHRIEYSLERLARTSTRIERLLFQAS